MTDSEKLEMLRGHVQAVADYAQRAAAAMKPEKETDKIAKEWLLEIEARLRAAIRLSK